MPVKRSERDARYNAKASSRYSLKLNRTTDAELIQRLEAVEAGDGHDENGDDDGDAEHGSDLRFRVKWFAVVA